MQQDQQHHYEEAEQVSASAQQNRSRPITCHTVTLGPLTHEGMARAEISEQNEAGVQHTVTLSIPAGLPGERVTIAVEAPATPPKKRRRYWKPYPRRVEITEIHTPSPLRTPDPCPVFGTCGGCQLQHMHYSAQLAWKRSIVQHCLQEIGHFTDPPLLETIPCADPWHYRNHMRFSVNRSGQVGLTARGTHRVLPLTHCPIAHDSINTALSILSAHHNERPQALIRCGTATGQILIQPQPSAEVAQQLTDAGLDLHSDTLEEQLRGETFRIRPSSFFQTNTPQAEKMAQMVLDGLLSSGSSHPFNGNATPSLQPLTLLDAYCGVGTFALLLARHVQKVIAIEESASSIKDARWNLREVHNVEILQGKVEDLLPTLSERLDGLVIDPPRAGCQRTVLNALAQHPVPRIVYVSCDPSTLARDLDILCHIYSTYRLRSVQPLDMFPHTAHIECVAVLESA